MKKFSEKEVIEYVRNNLDKRFIVFTFKDKETGCFIGQIIDPSSFVKLDTMNEMNVDNLVGIEFTKGISDLQGGHFGAENK